MKLNFCAVCGTTNDLQQHHIEPVVLNGTKRKKAKGYDDSKQLKYCDSMEIFAYLFSKGIITDDGEITVCSYHHNILHGIVKFQHAEHSKMIVMGQQRAKQNGVKLGRPSKLTNEKIKNIKNMRDNGMGIKSIAKKHGVGVGTIYSALNSDGMVEEIQDNSWINLIEN